MSISYVLYENHLLEEPDSFFAQVHYRGQADMDAILERMILIQKGSKTSKADAKAVLEDFFEAIEGLVLSGFKVVTPLGNYGIKIKGVFNGVDDSFDKNRHELLANITVNKQYRKKVAEQGILKKDQRTHFVPTLTSYVDRSSDTINSTLTPNGMGSLSGQSLKFNPADLTQGIFFVAADNSEIRVDAIQIGQIKPSELIFIVPSTLVSGNYTIQVRCLIGKELQPGTLNKVLTVV